MLETVNYVRVVVAFKGFQLVAFTCATTFKIYPFSSFRVSFLWKLYGKKLNCYLQTLN